MNTERSEPDVGDVTPDYDLVIIGGGVNGAGVARDAAGRGLSVLMCEKEDLAQHTSSASTKLVHGGLRYLEYYDFKLVRHALQEREVLLRAAPHIIWPLRFILPHHKSLRPRWLIRAGLFLYDNLGGRKLLPASHGVNLAKHPAGNALKKKYSAAFEYSDCWVQDSRLVVLNALDAKQKGAVIKTRTECIDLQRYDSHWKIKLKDNNTSKQTECTARCVVNASGPWVEKTLNLDAKNDGEHGVRLVKGSHIVVPRLFEHPYTYIFQNADNRVLFAVPYENEYTLLGTTDIELHQDPGKVEILPEEIEYICESVGEYFESPVLPESVVWSYAGVRPLYDDSASNASKVTRDYKLHLDQDDGAPILSVYGGKITTFRKLSEEVVDLLKQPLGFQSGAWTEAAALPGGDIPNADFEAFLQSCQKRYSWVGSKLLLDYARNYGTCIHDILKDKNGVSDLGEHFGGLLYQSEVDYLITQEFAQTTEDILWRRSKKGLHLEAADVEALNVYLQANVPSGSEQLKRVS